MLMPNKDRMAIYEYLFKEGVMVAKKDFNSPTHPDLQEIRNLHVIKALQSLKSRGYVTEQYAWSHFYWYLTNEGIQYLRDILHLPSEIVPVTLKRKIRQEIPKPKEISENYASEKDPYRKTGDVGPGNAPLEFRAGFGRGRGAPM